METYLARQPIYNLQQELIGYELLYRSASKEGYASDGIDGDEATCRVLSDALTEFGLKRLTNGKTSFVNFTRSLLLGNIFNLLHPQDFVIEILEDIKIDDELLQCIEYWHSQGFVFALDDYCGGEEFTRLLPFVDIIKVDFKATSAVEREKIAKELIAQGKKLLAEKVETGIEYSQAKAYGYSMFQGYYFDRPMVMKTKVAGVQTNTSMRIFREIARYEINIGNLAQIIKTDVNLSYKLLKHMATARHYRGNEIKSIDAALIRMGNDDVRHWVSLVFIKESTASTSDENVKIALVRGVFLEAVAKQVESESFEDAFMVGMFSMLAIISEEKLTQMLDEIKLSTNVKNALISGEGELGEILQFVKNYERANWQAVSDFIDKYSLDMEEISKAYIDAVAYADDTFD